MRSMAQFCIKDLHDATPSEMPPEDPITGQLWIDISVSPPVTKVWNAGIGKDLILGKILIRPCDAASAGADIYLLT